MRSTSLLALSLVRYLHTHTHVHPRTHMHASMYICMNNHHILYVLVCVHVPSFSPFLFHYATETSYDPEKDLKRQRKQKEKKIEEFQKAAKKKKKKESECITLSSPEVNQRFSDIRSWEVL